jgi:hypothetical protein
MRKAHAAGVENDSIEPFDAPQQHSAVPVNQRTLAMHVVEKSLLPHHAYSEQLHAAAGHAEQTHATVQVGGQAMHLPLPKALGAGCATPKNFTTLACCKTPDEKAAIEEFARAYLCGKWGSTHSRATGGTSEC